MGINNLTEIELVQGGLSLIIAIIFLIVGLGVVFKYFTNKQKEYITMGFALMIMSGYSIYAISFLTYIIFGFTVNLSIFLLATLSLALIAVMCWMYTFSKVVYPDGIKVILSIYFILCILLEIFLIYFVINNPDIIATQLGKFDIQVNIFGLILIGFALLSHIIPISIFSYNTIKIDNIEVKWRGIFILIGGISIIIGLLLEMRTTLIPIIILARIIVISSAIEYYIGWVLPRRVAKWFKKENKIVAT